MAQGTSQQSLCFLIRDVQTAECIRGILTRQAPATDFTADHHVQTLKLRLEMLEIEPIRRRRYDFRIDHWNVTRDSDHSTLPPPVLIGLRVVPSSAASDGDGETGARLATK
jgi:hypothetical protein